MRGAINATYQTHGCRYKDEDTGEHHAAFDEDLSYQVASESQLDSSLGTGQTLPLFTINHLRSKAEIADWEDPKVRRKRHRSSMATTIDAGLSARKPTKNRDRQGLSFHQKSKQLLNGRSGTTAPHRSRATQSTDLAYSEFVAQRGINVVTTLQGDGGLS
ncbi:hypothetical protein CCHR01_04190 [Colletotrichum chrysophilum]|uniref:Uncharacterized protein n=1 Tax=Colletotrichum chrysophilum TaxID=1836956 RepID=A0AAD9ELX5_9PEZI|nr:hypothetical protein CCHR01_04190 [Colletotrichum chrysophilum]